MIERHVGCSRDDVIFEDVTGRRRKWAAFGVLFAATLITVPFVVFLLGMKLEPHLPGARASTPGSASASASSSSPSVVVPPKRANIVFAAHEDPPGARSINAHLDQIDVIVTDWFRLPGAGCAIEETVDDASKAWATATHTLTTKDAKKSPIVVARLANLSGDAWTKSDGDGNAMLKSAETRTCVARDVAARAHALGASGINVDFESLAPSDADALVAFMTELRAAMSALEPCGESKGASRTRGATVSHLSIDVTPGDPAYDLARLGKIADSIVLMAYDEHEETSPPGSIASPAWFASVVDQALASVPRERLVVGVGSYCYDWSSAGGAEPLSFSGAMERAAAAKSLPSFRKETGGSTFSYSDATSSVRTKHEVWCADAASVENQLITLRARGLEKWALWRAGTEDPSIWEAAGAAAAALQVVPALEDITTTGSGDGWKMIAPSQAGKRDVSFDPQDGSVRAMSYRVVPTGAHFERLGGNAKREIVLTFDDGPDPEFTPKILDALRAQEAEATFFVLGEQAMSHPDLIERIGREGHLVGNHTFHHPHIDQISKAELLLELRSTERVLEGQLGRYSPLFRAPYTAAFDANAPELLATHLPAFEAGYTIVGGDVDPADWATPGASVIAARMIDQVEAGGRIVVLHDGGGDRSQTAAALAIALPDLRARGYSVVPLDQHLGIPRAAVVSPVDAHDEAIASGAQAASFVSSHGPTLLSVVFSLCTGLAGMRVVMLVALALRRRSRRRKESDGADAASNDNGASYPLVTILVPAYNEEKVLRTTVMSLLASDYPAIEVLIIDDGSVDKTYAVARAMAREDARVRCLRKRNGGKAAAANYGVRHARGEIIVSVDADTLISSDAVRMLVRRFDDPEVTAVCGNVEVGNVHSMLTAYQAIEYVTSQNLDRAALAEINAVNVVPGALGAWRRDVLLAVGGYAHDTLVEDADLTLTVLRAGGRIEYEAKAIARTEAPESLSALWKQRLRWTYGTYQCLAKHRRALFRGKAGLIALPNMVLFQVVFPLLSPIGDAVMVMSLVSGHWTSLLSGYVGFLAMDALATVIAFKLDNKPLRWYVLPLLLLQRFTYRQFMYAISLRAFIAAIRGERHGWRKLERTGAVKLLTPIETPQPSIAPTTDEKLAA